MEENLIAILNVFKYHSLYLKSVKIEQFGPSFTFLVPKKHR